MNYLLSLGSNLGDRAAYLRAARLLLPRLAPGGRLLAVSPVYETQAWGVAEQPPYLNQVLGLECDMEPQELLSLCLSIEKRCGRRRSEPWAARTLDIDLLAAQDRIVRTDTLRLPHPLLHRRRFVLEPLCSIAPDWLHPELNLTAARLLELCDDDCAVVLVGSFLTVNP